MCLKKGGIWEENLFKILAHLTNTKKYAIRFCYTCTFVRMFKCYREEREEKNPINSTHMLISLVIRLFYIWHLTFKETVAFLSLYNKQKIKDRYESTLIYFN